MKKSLTLALLLAAAPLAASAGELSYTYVEADFNRTNVDLDTVDFDFDGYALRGSFEFGKSSLYAFGGYAASTNDDLGIDIDLNESQLGLGYHHTVSDNADFLAEISYVNAEVKVAGFSEDADAYRASIGFRGEIAENFEGQLKVNYTDGDGSSEFAPSFGVQWKFNQTWGLVGDAELGSDTKRDLVGIRASF